MRATSSISAANVLHKTKRKLLISRPEAAVVSQKIIAQVFGGTAKTTWLRTRGSHVRIVPGAPTTERLAE
jgi:hypothetical protein